MAERERSENLLAALRGLGGGAAGNARFTIDYGRILSSHVEETPVMFV
jgi:hypothetical protein